MRLFLLFFHINVQIPALNLFFLCSRRYEFNHDMFRMRGIPNTQMHHVLTCVCAPAYCRCEVNSHVVSVVNSQQFFTILLVQNNFWSHLYLVFILMIKQSFHFNHLNSTIPWHELHLQYSKTITNVHSKTFSLLQKKKRYIERHFLWMLYNPNHHTLNFPFFKVLLPQ